MSDRVEAESGEAKRFLTALRGVLSVPKTEIRAKLANVAKRRKRVSKKSPQRSTLSGG